MQVIKVPGELAADDKFFLYFEVRWKFLPNKLQTSLTELTKEEAMHSFKRMFRDRTGFAWEDRTKRENRKPKPGKFMLD
jgi:hypothetical protein